MAKARLALLCIALAGTAAAGESASVAGCVSTSRTCTCYDNRGKPVQIAPELCQQAMAPSLVTVSGGNIDHMLAKPKVVERRIPFRKEPIPWLIER